MKVVIISHAYVVEMNQKKIESLGNYIDLDVTLIVPTCWNDTLRFIKLEKTVAKNYKIIPLPVYLNGHPFGYFYHPKLFKIMKKLIPDIIHIEEEPPSVVCFQVLLMKKFLRLPSKFVFFTWENIFKKFSFPKNFFEKVTLKEANGAICGNSDAKEILIDKGFNKKIEVIPQIGVELNTFNIEKKLTNIPVISYFGRIVKEKGLDTLFEAFSKIQDRIHLLIVGDGKDKKYFEEKAKNLNIQDRVFFTGVVPHNEVKNYLKFTKIVVLPSITTHFWKEQFGHILIEAMASGTPVIGSSSGAIPEVIGDAGLIFREGDSEDLKDKILELLKDEKSYNYYQEKSIKRVNNNFTNNIIAKKIYEFYQIL